MGVPIFKKTYTANGRDTWEVFQLERLEVIGRIKPDGLDIEVS